jgi:hypothetical protein
LAHRESDFKDMKEAVGTYDKPRLAKLITQGKILSVSKGTRVSIVAAGEGVREVNVQEGESVGAQGWVDVGWLRPLQPADLAARAAKRQAVAKRQSPEAQGAVQVITEPEKSVRRPGDPSADFETGAAFDNPSQGMRTQNSRGAFENPPQGPSRAPSTPADRMRRFGSPGGAPGRPDPSFENPSSEHGAPAGASMPREKNEAPR